MYVLSRALLLCNANESTKSLINRVVFTRDTSMQLFAHTIFYKLPGYKEAQKRGARLKMTRLAWKTVQVSLFFEF